MTDINGDVLNATAQWAAMLREPLTPTSVRLRVMADLERACTSHPQIMALIFAGILHDLVATLPSSDWMKRLSARYGSHVVAGEFLLPQTDGATGHYGRFGTISDGSDLTVPMGPETTQDPYLIAITDDLDAAQSAFFVFSSTDPFRGAAFLREVADGRLLEVAEAPVLRAAWRRDSHTTRDDLYLWTCALSWARRALTIASGKPWDPKAWTEEIRSASVDDFDDDF